MSNFYELALRRYSCRKYDPTREVEDEKLDAVLQAARLAPSACNGQPYKITVARAETAAAVAKEVTGMGMNKFAHDAPVMLVVSEMPYVKTAAVGSKLKKNDYRSMDIGLMVAYLTAEATEQGLGKGILGWFDNDALMKLCGLDYPVRLVITLGYPLDEPRGKKRKPLSELVKEI